MLLTRRRAVAITSRVLNEKDIAWDFPIDRRVALYHIGESGIGHSALLAGSQAPLVPIEETVAQGLEIFLQQREKNHLPVICKENGVSAQFSLIVRNNCDLALAM
jgi:hypothetical protein